MNKRRILLITDSIYSQSGVANMAKEIVYKSIDKYDYLIVGSFERTPNHGQKFDYSERITKETGVKCSVEEIQWNGYGTIELFEEIIKRERLDAILLMSDPRHHIQFFNYQGVISQKYPIIWYNIWDAEPAPHFNLPYYDSCDALLNISKLTDTLVREVLGDKVNQKVIRHIPHGVDINKFYPIDSNSNEYNDFKLFQNTLFNNKVPETVFLFNSVNMHRKNIGTLLEGYRDFIKLYPNDSICLILHTSAFGGYHIPKLIDGLFKGIDYKHKIMLTNQKFDETQMRYLYNLSDCIINTSFNEGWGLSLTEAVACGKPFIAPYHGGMSEQIENANMDSYSLLVQAETLTSSVEVPYIYQYYTTSHEIKESLKKFYQDKKMYFDNEYPLSQPALIDISDKLRQIALDNYDSNKMVKSIVESIEETIQKFKPQPKYTLSCVQMS